MGRPYDMILPPETAFLADSRAQQVCALLGNAGHQVCFVGGCVRNAVMGRAESDVDMCTDARPETVMALGKTAGLKALPTGIDHGTVTLVVEGQAFEVTTFRRDVETDGRRAVVAFSDRIEEDALRRDFTMNALYARPDGRIIDPLGGLPDALEGRVVFIQDARARMREDYLRLLRYFRFWAHYADQAEGFDAETLSAIADCLDGLAQLSAERIGGEILKLLAAPDPSRAVTTMGQVGVFAQILPVASTDVLPRLVHLEELTLTRPDPLRRLASLGPEDAPGCLRLSKRDARDLAMLMDVPGCGLKAIGQLYGAARGWDAALLRAAAFEQSMSSADRERVDEGAHASFPVKASDLDLEGPALGVELKRLREKWLASDLSMSRTALLG